MHDALYAGVPLVAILAGILFNRYDVDKLRNDIKVFREEVREEIKDVREEIKVLREEVRGEFKDVRGEIKELRSEINQRLDRIDGDLRQFYHLAGKLEGRIDTLEKR